MKKTVRLLLIVLCVLLAFGTAACEDGQGEFTPLETQVDIFTALRSKTADVGFMDYTLASYLIATDVNLSDFAIVENVELGEHDAFAVSAYKGEKSGTYDVLTDKINLSLAAVEAKGTYKNIADKYGLGDLILPLAYTKPQGDGDSALWDKVVKSGKIIIGYNTAPPMSITTDDKKKPDGFATELAKAVFADICEQEKVSIDIEFRWINFDNYPTEFQAGYMDIFWSDMSYTDERAEKLYFSTKFMQNRTCAVVRKEDKEKYSTVASMKKARLVAESAGVGSGVAKDILSGKITD